MTKVRTDKYMMEKKRQARNKQFWINVLLNSQHEHKNNNKSWKIPNG